MDDRNSGSSLFTVITCALVSSYIAGERPERSALGWWAEIAQAFSISLLILGLAVAVVFGLLALARGGD